ncbi:helix-turn-helix transcriptional regulator [Mucilaginibacter flavus]|uniref:helix-turn-helix transcriptional regulator n=1 Tax=Mucilaginibacter flavus TaxID=931504 RepID=UPI0025B31542|nr:helix-turn-helix transcriptional regulator [Mucilaginibacter flavus]MDN3581894.1 helix-turn-helix transcriptional regulator [Mucilaginibacter flavus]
MARQGNIHPYTFLPSTNIFKNRGTKHYEDDPQTIGEHIRKKRIKNNLLQREVAIILMVSEDTLTYWENERSHPQIHHYPAIISFLGYYPLDHETESFGGKLKQIRYFHGLTFKECARRLSVSVDAAKRWEQGKPIANAMYKNLILSAWRKLPVHFLQHPA